MKTPEQMAEEYAKIMSFEVNGHQRGFLAGYNAAAPKWISVKEKAPEINQKVLLATNLEKLIVSGNRLAPAGPNEPWFHIDTGLWCGTETVTHWMPLPTPPKEEV
jgi:hypothetical protein